MKVLVATEKPFAKVAVDGIRKEIEAAGFELALLEKYTEDVYKRQDVPAPLNGLGITVITVGLMAIAFMCFSGLNI